MAAGIGLNQGLTIVGSQVYISNKDELWSYVWHTICLAMILTVVLALLVSLGIEMQWVDQPSFLTWMRYLALFMGSCLLFPNVLLLILCFCTNTRSYIYYYYYVATLLLHLIALPLNTELLFNGIQFCQVQSFLILQLDLSDWI